MSEGSLPLSESEISARLSSLPGWERSGDAIRRQYRFDGFRAAMEFVNQVARLADEADHHPEILIEYSRVTLTLTTHDAGGLSERDFGLAARIDA